MAVQQVQLRAQSFPPGSSREFIDAITRVLGYQTETGKTAEQANQTAQGASTVADAQRVRNDQQDITLSDQASQIATMQGQISTQGSQISGLTTNAVQTNKTALQTMTGPLGVVNRIEVGGIKVLGARVTGWTANTGTQTKGGMNADQAYTAGAAYAQSEAQAVADGLIEVRRVLNALVAAGVSHGIIGP